MQADFPGATAPATPLADLLNRMALELRDLTQVVDDLQRLVGRLVAANAIRDAAAMHDLQNFDRLGQTLSGVANFAEALSQAAHRDWALDPQSASRAVALSELAARLMSSGDWTARSRSGGRASSAGEVELF
jgi:hypothetical protein